MICCYAGYSIVFWDLAHTLHSAYIARWDPLTDSPQTTYASLPARVICCPNAAHTQCVSGCICAGTLGVVWKRTHNGYWTVPTKGSNKGEGSKIVKVTFTICRYACLVLSCAHSYGLSKWSQVVEISFIWEAASISCSPDDRLRKHGWAPGWSRQLPDRNPLINPARP